MRSILFTTLVVCAIAYLAYSQSSDVKRWADNITQGRAADWVATVDEVKSDVVDGIDSGIERASEHAKKYETSVVELREKIESLQTENAQLRKELAQRAVLPLAAGEHEVLIPASGAPTGESSGTEQPRSLKVGPELSMAERSQSLLLLIEKMQMKSAGR